MAIHIADVLRHMRTTILLPDELYQRVRTTAAAERRTITSVIDQAVRDSLALRSAAPETKPFKLDVIRGGGGVLPGVDLDDNAALEDLMSDDEHL